MPGATQLTRMPSRPWCAAIARVILITAPLEVGYSSAGVPPISPAMEAMFTMAPAPSLRISGIAYLAISIIHVTFTPTPPADADVIDQNVDTAPGLHGNGNGLAAGFGLGDIDLRADGAAAFVGNH